MYMYANFRNHCFAPIYFHLVHLIIPSLNAHYYQAWVRLKSRNQYWIGLFHQVAGCLSHHLLYPNKVWANTNLQPEASGCPKVSPLMGLWAFQAVPYVLLLTPTPVFWLNRWSCQIQNWKEGNNIAMDIKVFSDLDSTRYNKMVVAIRIYMEFVRPESHKAQYLMESWRNLSIIGLNVWKLSLSSNPTKFNSKIGCHLDSRLLGNI